MKVRLQQDQHVIKIRSADDKDYLQLVDAKILLRPKEKNMSVILILLFASITVASLFLVAFLWGVRTGQFEDDYSPASRILFDDKPPSGNKTKELSK